MHQSFYHFSTEPFADQLDLDFFFKSDQQCDALTQMAHALDQGQGLIMLTGEPGAGKTYLSQTLLEMVSAAAVSARISVEDLAEQDLVALIANKFGLCEEFGVSRRSALKLLSEFLMKNASAGNSTVLIVDDAEKLSLKDLESVRLISNIETESAKLLQIVLVGRSQLASQLARQEVRQINQRIATRLHLNNLSLAEVESYIRSRIDVAGGSNFIHFDSGAVKYIFSLSQGKPGLVNLQCRKALRYGSQAKIRLIQTSDVREALTESRLLEKQRVFLFRQQERLVEL